MIDLNAAANANERLALELFKAMEDGRDLMTPHIAGVIEIRNGEIVALRDFYDTVCYEQSPSAPDPAHAQR